MAMTNVLLNINVYSDSVNYVLRQSICKRNELNIIANANLCPETISEATTAFEII